MEWLDTLYAVLFWPALIAIAGAAWRYGGKPERHAAAMYLAAAIASQFAITGTTYSNLEVGLTVIDTLLLVGLVWLALTADRLWPIPSAALQALSCLAHLEMLIGPQGHRLGYQLMAEAAGYPTLILLAVGIWRQHRREKRNA